MAYDLAGRQNVLTNELGYATTTTFDLNGRPSAVADANGRIKTMSYDPVGRQTGIQYTDGKILTLQYDALGRRATMLDWGGTTTYAYSARSQLTGKSDPGPLVQSYDYDAARNRKLLIDPDGGRYTYTFDALNKQSALQNPHAEVFTAQYDADDRVATLASGSASQRRVQYDPTNRITTLIEATTAGVPIMTIIDTWDAGGRKSVSMRDGVATTYSYDSANRLTGQQTAGGVATFTMDAGGNELVKWHQGNPPLTMSYDAANRLVSAVFAQATTNFTFDNAGNMTLENQAGAQTGYVYDGENRNVKVTYPDGTLSTYTYSGDGLRRTRQEPGKPVSTMVWDGSDYLGEI
jgi:YD repeat-containing protein